MKFVCPICETIGAISEENLVYPVIRAGGQQGIAPSRRSGRIVLLTGRGK